MSSSVYQQHQHHHHHQDKHSSNRRSHLPMDSPPIPPHSRSFPGDDGLPSSSSFLPTSIFPPSASTSSPIIPHQSQTGPPAPTATTTATTAAPIVALPARKQNVACDGCRGRKVKCLRVPGADKCEHCKAKGLDCTSHYVTSISSARKQKQAAKDRDPPLTSTTGQLQRQGGTTSGGDNASESPILNNSHPQYNSGGGGGGYSGSSPGPGDSSGIQNGEYGRTSKRQRISNANSNSKQQPFSNSSSTSHLQATSNGTDPSSNISNLLAYLFNPYFVETTSSPLGYRDSVGRQGEPGWPNAPTISGQPSRSHLKLLDEEERNELASDLIETFFQIAYIRLPVLDDLRFRQRYTSPSTDPSGPPSLALIAIILAGGAKFSENQLICDDRDECSEGLQNGRKRSRLVQAIVVRAAEVLEAERVFRVATMENLQTAMLMAVICGCNINEAKGEYVPFWVNVAVQHTLTLKINTRQHVQAIVDVDERSKAGSAFWIASWSDALCAAYYRRKPMLADEDFDLEPVHSWSANSRDSMSSTKGGLNEYLAWHQSLSALCRINRQISTQLWTPRSKRTGIALSAMRSLVAMCATWRDEHLGKVGVPTNWPSTWDFIAAVTACTSDATYHATWVLLLKAMDDYGIRELKSIERGELMGTLEETEVLKQEAEKLKLRVAEEALHGAMRISALAGVLTANSYLRLDPNALFHCLYDAGLLLAKLGRKEAQACIAGLRQYGLTFEEAFDRAEDLEAIVAEKERSSRFMMMPGGGGLHMSNVSRNSVGGQQVPSMQTLSQSFGQSNPDFSWSSQLSNISNNMNQPRQPEYTTYQQKEAAAREAFYKSL